MSSMESLDRLQAELQGNVNPSAYERLYNLTQLASIEHGELMAQAMKWVRKEKLEPLEAENAKLRELVRDMWFGLYCPTEPTDGCPQCTFNKDGECFFEQRMRELGIEVLE